MFLLTNMRYKRLPLGVQTLRLFVLIYLIFLDFIYLNNNKRVQHKNIIAVEIPTRYCPQVCTNVSFEHLIMFQVNLKTLFWLSYYVTQTCITCKINFRPILQSLRVGTLHTYYSVFSGVFITIKNTLKKELTKKCSIVLY